MNAWMLIFWTALSGPTVQISDFASEAECKQMGEIQKKMSKDPSPGFLCAKQAK